MSLLPLPVPGTPLGTDAVVFGDWHPSGFGSSGGTERECAACGAKWRGGGGCWACEGKEAGERA